MKSESRGSLVGTTRERRRRLIPYALMSPLTLFYLAVLLVPFALVVVTSLREYTGAFGVGGFTGLDNYHDFVFGPGQKAIIFRTIRIAALTTGLSLLIGYPTAHFAIRLRPRARSLVMMGLMAPLLTSVVARTFGWWTLLGPGPVGNWLGRLAGRESSLLFTETAVVIGMVGVFLPFMVIPIMAAMQNIDRNVRRAASSLGATPLEVFRRIDLPLSLQGVLGGIVIVASLSLSSFVTPSLLG